MDTELLKTFLEVQRTRHFGKAAHNLFLTQAAVSARIRSLEESVGVQLFTRQRNNIQLTAAGRKLVRDAETILNAWNRVRQEIAVDDEDRRALAIGGVSSLWDIWLQEWVHVLYRQIPDLVLNAEVLDADILLRRVNERTLDLAFMYESPQVGDLRVDEVAKIQLLMVSTLAGKSSGEAVSNGYVLVDWGTSFTLAHAKHFPDLPTPVLRVDLGRIAHAFVLERGGAAYLADSMVAADIGAGRLHLVEDAPVIDRSAYAVYSQHSEKQVLIGRAVKSLRNTAVAAAIS